MTVYRVPKPAKRPPSARKRPKAVNRKRKAKNFARTVGSAERAEWITQQSCVVRILCDWSAPRDGHHIKGDGAGRKSDAQFIVPLCRRHHRQIHDMGRDPFERAHQIDLGHEAAETQIRWRAFSGTVRKVEHRPAPSEVSP